ncbi:MAG: AAA family ATPase [Dehalococcoidia bacterium]|nr:AAA family ATPase [Dehalococcoidia bacterium]
MVKRLVDYKTYPVPTRPSRTGMASPFVGRESELRRLTAALTHALEGQGGTIFLVGQPGMGKTRLARESLALAKGRGFTVLEGHAFPLESGLAYAPLLDAFGPLLRSLDSSRLAILVDGLEDLGRLFGALRLPVPAVPPERQGNPALEKTCLFEAVSCLLERLSREAPVALLVDDVHWADRPSMEMLHYVARKLSNQRVLLLATYSEHALETSHGLQSLVVSLKRGGLAKEIVVPPLRSDAVDMLARGILGGKAPDALLALLHARAGQNPLFIEALTTGLVDSGDLVRNSSFRDGWVLDARAVTVLPPSVRHLVLERLARLTPADRRVLELVAVGGESTSHTVLRSTSGLGEETLLKTLRRLRAAGLVAEGLEGPDVIYSITHPLIQEVVYAELPEMARRRIHLAAIKAIESFSQGRPENLDRLARHYHGASSEAQNDRSLAVLLSAGERAHSLYANEEAARHYSAALTMVRQLEGLGVEGESPSIPALDSPLSILPEVLERLGEVWERTGERDAAIKAWNEALVLRSEGRERAGPSEERIDVSRLRCQLALAESDNGHFDMANTHLMAGLIELAEREPCQELADLLFIRFLVLTRLGDTAGLADTAAKLLSVAERVASPRAEAEANWVASISCSRQNDVVGARDRALHALMVSERAQESAMGCRAHSLLALSDMRLGDHRNMRSHAERGLGMAQHLGLVDLEFYLRIRLTRALFMAGAWVESLRSSADAVSLARRVGHPRFLAYSLAERAMALAYQGDLPEAETCISEARMSFGGGGPADRTVFGLIDTAETIVMLERGQAERATGIAMSFFHPSASAPGPAFLIPAYIPIGLMLLAEAQAASGNAESALETSRELTGLGPARSPYLSALASRAEGLARRTLGQVEAAIDCLSRAHETFTTLAMPFEAARSLLEQAEVRSQRTEHRGRLAKEGGLAPHSRALSPIQAAQQSLATFERLGARRYAERARRLLEELGVSPPATRRRHLGGVSLSAREFEVARLVAESLTTAEIGQRLTISPLTVTTHLRNIYARLGIGSRTALARYVTEAGLL